MLAMAIASFHTSCSAIVARKYDLFITGLYRPLGICQEEQSIPVYLSLKWQISINLLAVSAVWQEGDACLASSPEKGTLREGTILKLFSAPHTLTTALVRYTDHCNVSDQGEAMEEKEEIVPISELQRPGADCFERERSAQEKPLFHSSSLSPPGSSEPLILSQTGDRKSVV